MQAEPKKTKERIDPKDVESFLNTFQRIDYFCHVKEFKSLSETKLEHIYKITEDPDKQKNVEIKPRPTDFHFQMRRLLVQMVYFYYVAFEKKINLWVYNHYCINRWGVIVKYFSFQEWSFMKKIDHSDFFQNIKKIFVQLWELKTPEQIKHEEEEEQCNSANNSKQDQAKDETIKHFNNWAEFCYIFVEKFKQFSKGKFTPKQFIEDFEQIKHTKNNVMWIGVIVSTIFPSIKLNTNLQRIHLEICQNEPHILAKIFVEKQTSEGRKLFTNSIFRLFKAMSGNKILEVTSTLLEAKSKGSEGKEEEESLLAEITINLQTLTIEKQDSEKIEKKQEDKKQAVTEQSQSKTNSENDYNGHNEPRKRNTDSFLGNGIVRYYWSRKKGQNELSFRVTLSIEKKICALGWSEVEDAWEKLSAKWKVILDEKKQLSEFNPGFIMMGYERESNEKEVVFTDYLKCQIIQSPISELIMTTDKLIMAALGMREILCFQERRSEESGGRKEKLELNPGRVQDMARSICQSIKNYYNLCRETVVRVKAQKLVKEPHH